MKKVGYSIIALLIIGVICFWLFIAYPKYIKRIEQKNEIKDLKNLSLFNLDSVYFTPIPTTDLNYKGTVIIYFNSTCEYCQYEASEIKKALDSFINVSVIMVSSEPIRVIKEFSIEYKLDNPYAITFAKISAENINSTFGTISVPHTFIYNKNGNLIKEIRGESKVEAILNSLNEN